MLRNKQIFVAGLVLTVGMLVSCASGVGISTSKKYPIQVLYDGQTPDRPYKELGVVEISSEDSLSRDQLRDNRMMNRGNDAKTKELLVSHLVVKAQKMGADALINLKYKYYTSMKSEGYIISGTAVRYNGE